MPALLALAVLISVFACVFALQNTDPVSVSFLMWKKEASLALVLLGTFGLGAMMGLIACMPALIRAKWQGRAGAKTTPPALPGKTAAPAETPPPPKLP